MKLRSIIYSVAALSLLFAACKDQSVFTLSGTLKNAGSVKKAYLLEADSVQISVVDSTNINDDGKFQFKRTAPYANLYKLRVGGAVYDFIAQNGDEIKFESDQKDQTHVYTIGGSESSGKIQEFNKISNIYADKSTKISDEYQIKVQQVGHESDSLVNVYRPIFMKNMADYSQAVMKFEHDNSASLASFYAMSSLDPMQYEQQLVGYADTLKEKGYFSNNPGVQRFIRQMMEIKPISIGHKAPDFALTGFDGKPIKLSDYKDKYVMLDFWASWCGPCRHENPNVVKAYAQYKNKGFNILGISLDVDKGEWKKAIDADKLTWAHGSDLKRFDGSTEALYHIQAIPSNFIIDPQGIIVAKNLTGDDLENFLNRTFNKPQ